MMRCAGPMWRRRALLGHRDTFVNPRGERVTRADRLANLRAGRTAFDSIAHAPQEEEILTYGDGEVAVYTTRLTLGGRYGARASAASSAP